MDGSHISPSEMVHRKIEETEFKPRSAGLFYQVAVSEALALDRPDAAAGCLDVLLAMADELEAFKEPLMAIHTCLEDAVFDGPGKPHFTRAAELEADVVALEAAHV